MKKLLGIVVLGLIFCKIGFTEEITNFELEGISIGDSLFKYMSEEKMEKEEKESNIAYKNLGKQIFFEAYINSSTKDFDNISFFVKSNDKNKAIYAIYANKVYKNNVDECFARLNELTKQYDKDLNSLKKKSERLKIKYDPSGKSYLKRIIYKFNNGDRIAMECYDFDESFQKDSNYPNPDTFSISFNKKELYLWINP